MYFHIFYTSSLLALAGKRFERALLLQSVDITLDLLAQAGICRSMERECKIPFQLKFFGSPCYR